MASQTRMLINTETDTLPLALVRFFDFMTSIFFRVYLSTTEPLLVTEDDINNLFIGINMLKNQFPLKVFYFNINGTVVNDDVKRVDLDRMTVNMEPFTMIPLTGLELVKLLVDVKNYCEFVRAYNDKSVIHMLDLLRHNCMRMKATDIMQAMIQKIHDRWERRFLSCLELKVEFNASTERKLISFLKDRKGELSCHTNITNLKNLLDNCITFDLFVDDKYDPTGMYRMLFSAMNP